MLSLLSRTSTLALSFLLLSSYPSRYAESFLHPTRTTRQKRHGCASSVSSLAPTSERVVTGEHTSLNKERIEWIIRPATIEDRNQTAKLLNASYYSLLPRNYDEETLAKALPAITTPRKQLLTCGTWYVAEHPVTKDIVGCGGWTLRSPRPNATDVPIPNLRHFATHPEWTRCGVGNALWTRTWTEISQAVGETTALEVYSTLLAEPFYASLGFASVKRVEIPLAKNCLFPCIIMRREP